MVLRRMTAMLALAGLALLALATPALAHAELTGSNPAKGASVDTAPKQLQLTFNEPVSPQSITVAGPQGAQWTVGQVSVAGAVVTAPVTAVGPAGEYVITYQVLSEDNDVVNGTVNFTMTVAAAPAPTTTTTTETTTTEAAAPTSGSAAAAPAPTDDGGIPAWVWIVVAIAVVAAVGVLLLRRTRGGPAGPPESPAEP